MDSDPGPPEILEANQVVWLRDSFASVEGLADSVTLTDVALELAKLRATHLRAIRDAAPSAKEIRSLAVIAMLRPLMALANGEVPFKNASEAVSSMKECAKIAEQFELLDFDDAVKKLQDDKQRRDMLKELHASARERKRAEEKASKR